MAVCNDSVDILQEQANPMVADNPALLDGTVF